MRTRDPQGEDGMDRRTRIFGLALLTALLEGSAAGAQLVYSDAVASFSTCRKRSDSVGVVNVHLPSCWDST